MDVEFTTRVFKEGRSYVAQAIALDVSSCGGTESKAIENLRVAVRLFLEEAGRIGTLEQILQEAGYSKTKKKFAIPELVSMQRMSLPLTHAKA